MIRLALPLLLALLAAPHASAQRPKRKAKPQAATPADTLKVAKGFKVELLYSVPKDTEGSWVNLCVDGKNRLIVSDQYGSLYRVTPPAVGAAGTPKVEKVPAKIGMAQGLLWAFDALYVVVNGRASGLYRVTDSDGDDTLDKVELLRPFPGRTGEHGPHAVLRHPDGKRLTVVCGDQTRPAEITSSRVPLDWGEDHLLPRLPDGNGFMKGVLAPGGCIYNVTPDGKQWELVSIGFRNQYDAAYSRDGELFTFDADMEWDANTPWYRPTRVCQVVSGSDWGWRNGAGKYPVFYPDTLPPVVDIGPGSPTGVTFGYGAKFPAKYQDAYYICDWSYGKLYAVHLTPQLSHYSATVEEFVTGTPLPLTDVIINPKDGAMYFTIGGRKTQSGLYRITYTGSESTAPAPRQPRPSAAREATAVRHGLEAFHGKRDPKAVAAAWPALNHPDRFVRYAARIALEWQPPAAWGDKALAETNTQSAILALLALVRTTATDPFHVTPTSPKADPALGAKIAAALERIDFAKLPADQRLDLLRVYEVFYVRYGAPNDGQRKATLAKFDPAFPTGNRFVDGELTKLLVYLQDPTVAAKAMKLVAEAPTQEEQLEYVRALRMLKAGWTPELRKQYFTWFLKAAGYKGGNSFQGFLRMIKADAVATLSPEEAAALKPTLDAKPTGGAVAVAPPRPFVKKWTLDELLPAVEKGLKAGGRDFDHGRKMFGAARCFACHRFDNEGGSAGPDLTGVAGRFAVRDLLESILDPNKEISDQYAAVEIDTLDGRKVVGRIVNLNGNNIMVNTDMLNPNGIVAVNRDNIDRLKASKVSMMPTGLLDTLTKDEILDLMAYLLSRGDRNGPMFKK
jgi:putative heme-binding domain-containing protein